MKLYLKQKVFSWKDQGTVKDENGNDKYYIEGKVFSLGKQLTVRDANQNDVAFIKQKVLTYFKQLEDPCLEDYAVEVLNDPYEEKNDLVKYQYELYESLYT